MNNLMLLTASFMLLKSSSGLVPARILTIPILDPLSRLRAADLGGDMVCYRLKIPYCFGSSLLLAQLLPVLMYFGIFQCHM